MDETLNKIARAIQDKCGKRGCPLKCGSSLKGIMCVQKYDYGDKKGLYIKCCMSKNWEEQLMLARQIANLKERENI